ncbi:MAG: Acetyl-coenzyme A carboxylase carboxyl transferase subunit beta [Candidatus Scalindua arabica]|uniref:Acetyl-coenzyme A carboxylase carboxyl transferase subunit beta n=1 Tax=Candidatus Scalindua arabica TaxID=1127984 RepID=A0A941VYI6_9BACT|nr:Acetyl-coenzyme A carboxylase carboxyl transferase subunit beta [Candidatus Scalindua arabica]
MFFKRKKSIPDGLWKRCDGCKSVVYNKQVELKHNVCPECNYHFRVSTSERIKITLDEDSFEEYWNDMVPADPLNFEDRIKYKDRIVSEQNKTNLNEAATVGKGLIDGKEVVFGVTDSTFIMGSMGSVVGEKITRAAEKARELWLPLIIISGSGGGARMHEGALSLMQMAKTCAAISRLQDAGLLFISVLTDPTLGGVMASFASQADIIMAEPGALVGFAGPRVIKETIKKTLPKGFQSSESMLKHGFIDIIAERGRLKPEISKILDYCNVNTQQLQLNCCD